MIPKDYRYITRTKQGYQILSIWQDRYGGLNIAGYRPQANDYFTARGYDPTTGTWTSGGAYMLDSLKEAEDIVLSGRDGPYTRFDVHDQRDVDFEYDSQYNWNHVDDKWLKSQDHRAPGFSTRKHSNFTWQRTGAYFEDGKVYEDSEEGFRAFKRDYRTRNAPQRSYSVKSGVYEQRRAKVKNLFRGKE